MVNKASNFLSNRWKQIGREDAKKILEHLPYRDRMKLKQEGYIKGLDTKHSSIEQIVKNIKKNQPLPVRKRFIQAVSEHYGGASRGLTEKQIEENLRYKRLEEQQEAEKKAKMTRKTMTGKEHVEHMEGIRGEKENPPSPFGINTDSTVSAGSSKGGSSRPTPRPPLAL